MGLVWRQPTTWELEEWLLLGLAMVAGLLQGPESSLWQCGMEIGNLALGRDILLIEMKIPCRCHVARLYHGLVGLFFVYHNITQCEL